MTSLLTIVILLVIAYSGSILFQKIKIKSTFIKSLAYTGILYIALGYSLSPRILGFFSGPTMGHMNLIFAIVLGWVGFLVGLQAKVSGLKRFPYKYYLFSSINFVLVFGLSALLLLLLLNFFGETQFSYHQIFVISLAGAISSPIMLAVVVRENRVSSRLAHLLQFQSAYDNLLGIITIGAVTILMTAFGDADFYAIFSKGLITLAVSMLVGTIYFLLSKNKPNNEEQFLYVLGLLIFLVGTALYIGMSILLASLIFGIIVANILTNTRRLYLTLQPIENTMYILLLIFAGANSVILEIFLLPIMFFAIHIIVKLIGSFSANYSLDHKDRHKGWLGIGNLGTGGLSLAIVLDYFVVYPSEQAQILLFTIILTLVVQDGISLIYLEKRLIRKK